MTCRANQWAGFYMIGTPVMKELKINLGIKIIPENLLKQLHFSQKNS